MRTFLIVLAALLVSASAHAKGGSHAVKGHVTKDGTYVAPHQQTNPNGTKVDNWSSKPNVNPYTGKTGTVDPLKPVRPRK